MYQAVAVWVLLTLVTTYFAWVAIWSRRPSKARWLAVLSIFLAAPLTAGSLFYSLGWAIPYVQAVTIPEGKHSILGAKIIKDEAIYVLIDIGDGAPRYYRIPWDPKEASDLQEKLDDQDSAGTGVIVPPFEFSFEQRRQYYSLPQPKVLPDKPRQEETVPGLDI